MVSNLILHGTDVVPCFFRETYRSRIRLANCLKSRSNCCLILFLSVTGVGMNLSTFDITPTWSSVNGVSERFLRYFLFVCAPLCSI